MFLFWWSVSLLVISCLDLDSPAEMSAMYNLRKIHDPLSTAFEFVCTACAMYIWGKYMILNHKGILLHFSLWRLNSGFCNWILLRCFGWLKPSLFGIFLYHLSSWAPIFTPCSDNLNMTCAIYLPDYSLTVGCDTYLHDAGFESKVEILVACKVAKCSVQESE